MSATYELQTASTGVATSSSAWENFSANNEKQHADISEYQTLLSNKTDFRELGVQTSLNFFRYPGAEPDLTTELRPALPAVLVWKPWGRQTTAQASREYKSAAILQNEGSLYVLSLIATGIQALALKEADQLLKDARAAALANDLPTAYERAYLGFDILLRSAKWKEIGSQLKDMCSVRYPALFGIGVARFLSEAASRIPNWSSIIELLKETATRQKLDVARAMRGLSETHGVS